MGEADYQSHTNRKIELGVAVDSSVTEENKDFDVNPYA